MKEITYVTGNWAKIESARQYLEPLGIKVSNIKMETNEIQADSVEEVAKHSAKLLNGEENRSAKFIEAFAYCEYGSEPVVFTSITKGTIAKEKSGEYGWSWDYIFIPDGKDKTMANYPDEKRFLLWSNEGYEKLIEYLKNKE